MDVDGPIARQTSIPGLCVSGPAVAVVIINVCRNCLRLQGVRIPRAVLQSYVTCVCAVIPLVSRHAEIHPFPVAGKRFRTNFSSSACEICLKMSLSRYILFVL